MSPFRWGLNGEWGHCNRSIASSLGRSGFGTKASALDSASLQKIESGEGGIQDSVAANPWKDLPDTGAYVALEGPSPLGVNVAPLGKKGLARKKCHKGGGKGIKPVDILTLFPDCNDLSGTASQ